MSLALTNLMQHTFESFLTIVVMLLHSLMQDFFFFVLLHKATKAILSLHFNYVKSLQMNSTSSAVDTMMHFFGGFLRN